MANKPIRIIKQKHKEEPKKRIKINAPPKKGRRITIRDSPRYKPRTREEGPRIKPGETVINMNVPILIDEEIGRGGLGMVYRGHSTENPDRNFAVKISRKTKDSDSLVDEAVTASRSGNKNVIGTTHFKDGKYDYLAMVSNYIKGCNLQNLFDYHVGQGTLPPVELVGLVGHRLAKKLKAIHRNGEIHGDMSPEQAMIHDELELIDAVGRPPEGEIALAGKTCYIAPEYAEMWRKATAIKKKLDGASELVRQKAEQGKISERERDKKLIELTDEMYEEEDTLYHTDFKHLDLTKTDIFGTGVSLYSFLTGVNPLIGSSEDPSYRYNMQSLDNMLRSSDINSDVPVTLSNILAASTRQDPSARLNAPELYSRFHNYLFGEPEVKGAGLNDDTFFFYLKYLEMRDFLEGDGLDLDDEPVKPYLQWFPNGVRDDTIIDPTHDEGLLRKVAFGKYRRQAQEQYPGKHMEETPFAENITYGDLKRNFDEVFTSSDIEAGLRNHYKMSQISYYEGRIKKIDKQLENASEKGLDVRELESKKAEYQDRRDNEIVHANSTNLNEINERLIDWHTSGKNGSEEFDESSYYAGIVEGISKHYANSFQI